VTLWCSDFEPSYSSYATQILSTDYTVKSPFWEVSLYAIKSCFLLCYVHMTGHTLADRGFLERKWMKVVTQSWGGLSVDLIRMIYCFETEENKHLLVDESNGTWNHTLKGKGKAKIVASSGKRWGGQGKQTVRNLYQISGWHLCMYE
jgi:hypothetical protein